MKDKATNQIRLTPVAHCELKKLIANELLKTGKSLTMSEMILKLIEESKND